MQVLISADKSQFTVSGTMTDGDGLQHVLNGKILLDFDKQVYKVRMSAIPSEVIDSDEFEGAMLSMFRKIRKEGGSLLDSYLETNGSGKQLSLFGGSDADEDENEHSASA